MNAESLLVFASRMKPDRIIIPSNPGSLDMSKLGPIRKKYDLEQISAG